MSLSADTLPVIFGCNGPVLEADEKTFFRGAKPAGFILFQKNCVDPQQVMRLCADLRETLGWKAPVLIDQEGGRVQRLKPPAWPGGFPALRTFGDLCKTDRAAALTAVADHHTGLAGAQLPLGIDVDCVPVLDVVPAGNAARAIDDRSFGSDPDIAADLGIAAVKASIAAGMTPVMKHMPGHGRAVVDSHFDLPRVSADRDALARDWQPFRAVAGAVDNDCLWGMTAHVVYEALDPDLPATLSSAVINDIIRAEIRFDGLLVSDDLFMEALAPWGDVPERTRKTLEAGVDIALHCHGGVKERARAAGAAGPMKPETFRRLEDWARTRG